MARACAELGARPRACRDCGVSLEGTCQGCGAGTYGRCVLCSNPTADESESGEGSGDGNTSGDGSEDEASAEPEGAGHVGAPASAEFDDMVLLPPDGYEVRAAWREYADGNERGDDPGDEHESMGGYSADVDACETESAGFPKTAGAPPVDHQHIASLGPAWWVTRGPCRACFGVNVPCIPCIGSEADPRRHTAGPHPVTGLPVMVDCTACKAAVDAAEACGQVVIGVGFGGTGSHCDAVVRKPVATYLPLVVPLLGAPHCSPPFETPDA